MALTLLRHAALEKKHQHRYNGWTDLPIDPTLFDSTKISHLTQKSFDDIYASDLSRCKQTLDMMGIKHYNLDKRLREVAFKDDIEGLNFSQIERLTSYKKSYLETQASWHNYICKESQEDFKARINHFLSELPTSKEILICSHAGTLQTMLSILGYKQQKLDYLDYIRIDNVI